MDSRRGLDMWGPLGRWAFLNWPRGSWQYDMICGAIIVGLFVLPNPPSQAALDIDGVLIQIEAADESLESFTADMSATEHIVLFDDEETESGTVAFLKPAFFRREVTEPNDRTEVIAENQITVYIPRIKQAQVIDLGESAEGQDMQVPGLASSAELKAAYDVSLQGVGEQGGTRIYTVRLVPKVGTTAAKHYKSIVMDVAEGDWHPARRIVLEDHVGDTNTIVLSNVRRNPGLEPDDFELDLPDDTEIVRQRGGTTS